jgi:hypothetical protein
MMPGFDGDTGACEGCVERDLVPASGVAREYKDCVLDSRECAQYVDCLDRCDDGASFGSCVTACRVIAGPVYSKLGDEMIARECCGACAKSCRFRCQDYANVIRCP